MIGPDGGSPDGGAAGGGISGTGPTGSGTGGTGTSSGGAGTSTGGGSSTGGAGTAGSQTCPGLGVVGCGTLSVQNGPFGDFVWDTIYPVAMGVMPSGGNGFPSQPAIVFGTPGGGGFTVWVNLPTCPVAIGTVMEQAEMIDVHEPTPSAYQHFIAAVDFEKLNGGIAGDIRGIAGPIPNEDSSGNSLVEGTFAFPASLGAGLLCDAPPNPLPMFGPQSVCSAEMDAGCSASNACAFLADGGQPTTIGTLVVEKGENICLSTYASTPVSVTITAQPNLTITATAPDGGWEMVFYPSCCPNGLGTVPGSASFDNFECNDLLLSGIGGVLTVESLDGGLAGNLYANDSALYFSFDPAFTTPLDAGPQGALGGVCYPCGSSSDDGGLASLCNDDRDCCDGNCVFDAGRWGLCQ